MRFLSAAERTLLREMLPDCPDAIATEAEARSLRDLELRGCVERDEHAHQTHVVWNITRRGRLALECFDAVHGASVMS